MIIREGGIIKDGYNEEVDKLRQAKTEGKNWLAQLEDAGAGDAPASKTSEDQI